MFKNPTKIFACALLAILTLNGYSQAQITLDVDPTIEVGTNETVSLSGFGTDLLNVLNFILVVEDGGPVLNGSSTAPSIVDVAPASFFAGTPDIDFSPGLQPGDEPLAVIGVVSDIAASASPGASGAPLISISFDTSDLVVGDTFDLSLEGGAQTTTLGFDPDGEGAETASVVEVVFPESFEIEVVGSAVPEPSAICVLAGMGCAAMLRRRRL